MRPKNSAIFQVFMWDSRSVQMGPLGGLAKKCRAVGIRQIDTFGYLGLEKNLWV
jgi:hypothetical protein